MYHSLTFLTGGLHFPLHLRAHPVSNLTKFYQLNQSVEFVGTLKTGYPRIQVLSQDKEQGGLRRCHVSHVSGLCLTERRAPALPHVPQLRTSPPRRGGLRCCHVDPTSPPREESSGAATYPMATSGLWTTGIKKGLTAPGTQLGSHVSKARSRVTEAPARRADRPLQFGSTVQRRPS
jgi:hypothetical protein